MMKAIGRAQNSDGLTTAYFLIQIRCNTPSESNAMLHTHLTSHASKLGIMSSTFDREAKVHIKLLYMTCLHLCESRWAVVLRSNELHLSFLVFGRNAFASRAILFALRATFSLGAHVASAQTCEGML